MAEPQQDFFRALAETLIRVWAATVIVYGGYLVTVAILSHIISSPADQAASNYMLLNTVSRGGYLGMGVAIWFSAGWLSKAAVPKKAVGVESPLNVPRHSLVSIGCFLVGVYFLLDYLPDVIVETVKWVRSSGDSSLGWGSVRPDFMVGKWIGVLLALFFVLGARNIVVGAVKTRKFFSWLRKFFSWLRTADIKPDDGRDGAPPGAG